MKKLFLLALIFIFNVSFAQDIKIINKEIKDSSAQLRYYTSAIYPQLDGMKDTDIQKKINTKIKETMMKGINDFVKDMSEWDVKDIPADFNSEIEYNYTSYLLNKDIFSFSFDVFSFYAGAAHPNHWTISMNFDLKKGKQIEFKELFKPEVKYLDKISKYCIEDLKLQARMNEYEFDDFMLQDGAGAKDSNFMNYNFIQRGLQITFDPYSVAPYVMGTQYVFIPYMAVYEFMSDDIQDKVNF